MTVNSEEFVHDYANRMVPLSQRQLPVFSQVGKGLRGDSSIIAFDSQGASSKFIGQYLDQLTGETTVMWELPILSLVPKLHYETWKGVREIDGINMWGYYNKFTCDIMIENEKVTFWTFDTPFVVTNPFNGVHVPADYKIDSDEE